MASAHVLIAEDDRVVLATTEALLRNCGYTVSIARDGKEAIQARCEPKGRVARARDARTGPPTAPTACHERPPAASAGKHLSALTHAA